jgi:hypothetical protein
MVNEKKRADKYLNLFTIAKYGDIQSMVQALSSGGNINRKD